ncbi:MAG: hypothetical protein O7G85_10685 [Planctomycetota bacterium]|nr:hypothetical protein [Planctomycetota bacterium]
MPLPSSHAGFKLKNGNVYTSKTPTNDVKVKDLVKQVLLSFAADNKKQLIWILSGTHGTDKGELVAERKFFWSEDKALEGQIIKAVDVFNFSKPGKISANSWNRYLGKSGIVILAWCFSEQSRMGWMKDEKLKKCS